MSAVLSEGVETGLRLLAPGWLWIAPVACAAVVLAHRRAPALRLAAVRMLASRSTPALPRTWRQWLAPLSGVLEAMALVLFAVALAQPAHVVAEPPEREGRDVLLCFDRSSSMAADDLAPGRTRLDVGKLLAAEFVAARRDDRIGFVTFARYADLGCPPTADHDALFELLASVRLVDAEGPEDATAIGAAVGLAADLLQRSEAAGKVVVLLTDGEENVAVAGAEEQIAPVQAGQWCKGLGVRVHTIVLGKGQRRPDGSFAALDTTAVRTLATATGGRFFTAADEASLQQVYAEIDRLEAALYREPGVRIEEWWAWFVWGGLGALALAHALRHGGAGVLR